MDKEDTAVDSDLAVSDNDAVNDDEEFQIQIESIAEETNGEEKVYKTTSADAEEIRTIAATDEKAQDDLSTPIIVLAIAGGAALVGGAVLLANKKKVDK